MAQRLLAAVLLILTMPLLALLVLLVLLLDGRPVLFPQERLGVGRRTFRIWKLRTMSGGEVTRLGRVLRRTGLDELPQLVNIVVGDMRFIGPRPLTEADVRRLAWDLPEHDSRWLVPPGVTGYAQLATVCDRAVSWSLDEHYARNRTLALDLRIVTASAAGLVLGKRRAKGWFWR